METKPSGCWIDGSSNCLVGSSSGATRANEAAAYRLRLVNGITINWLFVAHGHSPRAGITERCESALEGPKANVTIRNYRALQFLLDSDKRRKTISL